MSNHLRNKLSSTIDRWDSTIIKMIHGKGSENPQSTLSKTCATVSMIAAISCAIAYSSLSYADVKNPIILDEKDRNHLSVVIYNQNLAMIKDDRTAYFHDEPISTIEFKGVSPQINASSALLSGVQRIVEQNFDSEILSFETLLNHHTGKEVSFLREDHSGADEITILNVANGHVIARSTSGDIFPIPLNDSLTIKRFVFNSIPDTLRVKPTLSMKVEPLQEGTSDISLSYLTSGLSWLTDYVADIDYEGHMSINAWVTINNHSGISYSNANVELIAGEVNTHAPKMRMQPMMMESLASDSYNIDAESAGDYKLYKLPFSVDLLNSQQKQVSLFSASDIEVQRNYKTTYSLNSVQVLNSKPDIFVVFDNTKDNQLGQPMPRGTIRFYQSVNDDRYFIGESMISDTAENETIESRIGKAFDITIDHRHLETNLNRSARNDVQGTIKVKHDVRNASESSASVTIDVSGYRSIKPISITVDNRPMDVDVIQPHPGLISIPVHISGKSTTSMEVVYSVNL